VDYYQNFRTLQKGLLKSLTEKSRKKPERNQQENRTEKNRTSRRGLLLRWDLTKRSPTGSKSHARKQINEN
jgi:hypothetical protein